MRDSLVLGYKKPGMCRMWPVGHISLTWLLGSPGHVHKWLQQLCKPITQKELALRRLWVT